MIPRPVRAMKCRHAIYCAIVLIVVLIYWYYPLSSKSPVASLSEQAVVHDHAPPKGDLLDEKIQLKPKKKSPPSLFNAPSDTLDDPVEVALKAELLQHKRTETRLALMQIALDNYPPLAALSSAILIRSLYHHKVDTFESYAFPKSWPADQLDVRQWRTHMMTHSYTLPETKLQRPMMGNGFLGLLAFDSFMHMRGVYVDEGESERLADIPSFILCNITEAYLEVGMGQKKRVEVLPMERLFQHNMADATFTQIISLDNLRFVVWQRVYAHWRVENLLVHEIEVWRRPSTAEEMQRPHEREYLRLTFNAHCGAGGSADLGLFDQRSNPAFVHPMSLSAPDHIVHKEANVRNSDKVFHLVYTEVSSSVDFHVSPGQPQKRWKHTFLLSADYNEDNAWKHFTAAKYLLDQGDELYGSHAEAVRRQWLQQSAYPMSAGENDFTKASFSAQYALFVHLPHCNQSLQQDQDTFLGSKGLISANSFNLGSADVAKLDHVTWDQELWLQPWLMFMNPTASTKALLYRLDRLKPAIDSAKGAHQPGAMFPIESGSRGVELAQKTTPSQLLNAGGRPGTEDEVSGLVSWTLMQFLTVHNRSHWVEPFQQNNALQLLTEVAKYFSKRLVLQNSTKFDIFEQSVVDRYAHKPRRNPIILRALAQLALEAPAQYLHAFSPSSQLAAEFQSPARVWREEADRISKVAFIEQTHQPYLAQSFDYQHSRPVMLSEALFWTHPFNFPELPSLLKETLVAYEKVVGEGTSCMNYAIHAINWFAVHSLDPQNAGVSNAMKQQLRCLHKSPFHVWHNSPIQHSMDAAASSQATSGRIIPSLIPAAAFAQTLLFGYWGVRVHSHHLTLQPHLPLEMFSLHLRGLHYAGNVLDVMYVEGQPEHQRLLRLTLRSVDAKSPQLDLQLEVDNPLERRENLITLQRFPSVGKSLDFIAFPTITEFWHLTLKPSGLYWKNAESAFSDDISVDKVLETVYQDVETEMRQKRMQHVKNPPKNVVKKPNADNKVLMPKDYAIELQAADADAHLHQKLL